MNNNGGLEPPEFFYHNLPPGFRFLPTDEELIWYLSKKVSGKRLPANPIFEFDPYAHNPWELTGAFEVRETEWYFFIPRDRKYNRENRPRDGYWKPTRADADIIMNPNGHTIGFKKALDFYHPLEKKTEWKMDEYTLSSMNLLDNWVLCKVYKISKDQNDN